jgi:hypothetical protein
MDYQEMKNSVFKNIIMEFLEFCYENPECSLYRANFYENETKIIDDFLKNRDAEED